MSRQQRREKVLPAYRVRIEQLGESQGGLINPSADYSLALMSFVGVFIAWCVAVLLSGEPDPGHPPGAGRAPQRGRAGRGGRDGGSVTRPTEAPARGDRS